MEQVFPQLEEMLTVAMSFVFIEFVNNSEWEQFFQPQADLAQ